MTQYILTYEVTGGVDDLISDGVEGQWEVGCFDCHQHHSSRFRTGAVGWANFHECEGVDDDDPVADL